MILHQRVILEPLDGMYVYIHTTIGTDDLRTLPDMSYASLAQYVKFFIAKLFGGVHVPLGGGKTLWRHVKCSVAA